jgi:hypothetical protein
VSVRVQGIIDGDRAYFRTWSRSGTVKRLREANGMQVTPCDVLGLCSYGPPLDAAARLLADEEPAGSLDSWPSSTPFGAVSWPGCAIGRGTDNWCITSFWAP